MSEVKRVSLSSSGRDFEEEFISESAVAAFRAAQRFYTALGHMSGRELREVEPGRVRVKWWSMD